MKRSSLRIAWLLLGVLAIASVLITLGKREGATNPQIDSYGPSGLRAFADLLRQNGYDVKSTSAPYPNLLPSDVVVACVDEQSEVEISPDAAGIFGKISSFTMHGGHLALLLYPARFEQGPETIKTTASNTALNKNFKVVMRDPKATRATSSFFPDGDVSADIWQTSDNQTVGSLLRDGKGVVLQVPDGFIGSNRYVDQAENASLIMNMMSTIAPKGSRIVFTDATFSGVEPSLVELLGPGTTAVWYQIIFLFIVVVFTLGQRFGLPEWVRPKQTGQRELVDAIADTYRRARSTRVACRYAYDRADGEVRKVLKLSDDAPASERDSRLPQELAQQFRTVFEGTIDSLAPSEAFQRCQRLRRQVLEFTHVR